MTSQDASRIAIWAVGVADRYNVQITKVIELFKAMNEFHKDVEVIRNMIEQGFLEGEREGLANEQTANNASA